MDKIPVEEAVGMVLAHDMTKIVKDEFKGVAFRKGHIIESEDIEVMKNMGKYHIFVYKVEPDDIHENDGAQRVADLVAGNNVRTSEAKEGKVNLYSRVRGKLEINLKGLDVVNEEEGIILATRHRDIVVDDNEKIAGAKIIPLVIKEKGLLDIEKQLKDMDKIINVKPFKPLKVGVLVTGTEVYEGRIKDAFAPVLCDKVTSFGGQVISQDFAPDDLEHIKAKVALMIQKGCDFIMVSGGMSVDPDDLTPTAIRSIATEVVTYGSPVLPGAMFMMAYHNQLPIVGIPACGMFNKITVLDLILPHIFTETKVNKNMIKAKAHGGLCLQCSQCQYPHCEFGKA